MPSIIFNSLKKRLGSFEIKPPTCWSLVWRNGQYALKEDVYGYSKREDAVNRTLRDLKRLRISQLSDINYLMKAVENAEDRISQLKALDTSWQLTIPASKELAIRRAT